MTLVVVIKCKNGLVLGADSRQIHYYANGNTEVRKVDKISTFNEPYNNIGVLVCGDLSLTSQYEWLHVPKVVYSIATWMELFKEKALGTIDPQTSLSVNEFSKHLYAFLNLCWQSSRNARLVEVAKMKEEWKKHDSIFPSSALTVFVIVAGTKERR